MKRTKRIVPLLNRRRSKKGTVGVRRAKIRLKSDWQRTAHVDLYVGVSLGGSFFEKGLGFTHLTRVPFRATWKEWGATKVGHPLCHIPHKEEVNRDIEGGNKKHRA